MEVKKKKYQRPQIEVICSNPDCNKSFMKDGSEVRRNKKIGRANYCSLECSGKVNNKHLIKGNVEHLKNCQRGDKYTGLREHFNRVKNGGRNQEYDITLDDLLNQWEKQNGICPYTGLTLIQPKDAKGKPLMYKASLDRIDSNLGYVVGNIQFISATANLAKHKMSHNEMVEFCKIIAEKWSKGTR